MSRLTKATPEDCLSCPRELELAIVPRTVDIGGFEVHRALPHKSRQMVGPFIFWDQMGPGEFAAGKGVDVRPHPHIGLSTLTYLFDGSMDHKDSLGSDIRIHPEDVNLMSAGKGIVHSERTGQDVRRSTSRLFGIQSWLAQPKNCEENLPEFKHFPRSEFPTFADKGISGSLIMGDFHGMRSPIQAQWETLYVVMQLEKDTALQIPGTVEERALFIVSGEVEVGGQTHGQRQLLVLRPGSVTIKATADTQLILLGGAPMDGRRYIWWNLVSSSLDRLKQAADDWQQKKFPLIPDDDKEFIPLPDLSFPQT